MGSFSDFKDKFEDKTGFKKFEEKSGLSDFEKKFEHATGMSKEKNLWNFATAGVSGGVDLFNREAQEERHRVKDAQKVAEGAALRSENALNQIQEQNRADSADWRTAGQNAINKLSQMTQAGPGQFTPGPRYQERFKMQVERPLAAQASASGRLGGGAYQKQLRRGAMDFAGQEHDNWLNRYYASLQPQQALAGMGQTVVGQGSTAAMKGANALGQSYLNQAAVQGDIMQGQAATQANQYNALAQGASAAGSAFDQWNANRNSGSSFGVGGGSTYSGGYDVGGDIPSGTEGFIEGDYATMK